MDQYQGFAQSPPLMGPGAKGEVQVVSEGVGDTLQISLNMLNDVDGYIETIKSRLHGPRPAEVAQAGNLAQPNIRQSAELIRSRISVAMNELREIAGSL